MNIPSFDPEKNYLIYILDMHEAIEKIQEYVGNMTEVEFSKNMLVQDAVIRRLQIIGEAAGRVPQKIREKFIAVPWKKIVAFRNLIIHDYATVKFSEVWRVIQEELLKLQKQLEEVKKNLEPENKL